MEYVIGSLVPIDWFVGVVLRHFGRGVSVCFCCCFWCNDVAVSTSSNVYFSVFGVKMKVFVRPDIRVETDF